MTATSPKYRARVPASSPHFALTSGNQHLPLRTVAVFNLTDETRSFSLSPAKLCLAPGDYLVTDVWSVETTSLSTLGSFELKGRSSRLLAISRQSDGQQVLDANIKVDGAWREREALAVRLAHRGDLDLVVSTRPSGVMFEGQAAPAEIAPGNGNWHIRITLPGPGVLQVR